MRWVFFALAALCCAPTGAVELSRVSASPMPVLRVTPLAVSAPVGLALLAPALPQSLSLAKPSLDIPAPVPSAIPELRIPSAHEAPVAATSLDRLIAFADNLEALAAAASDSKPALDSFWSGAQARSAEVASQGPSYLDTPKDKDFIQLGSIVAAARRTAPGRKILDDAMALSRKQGKPIQVRFQSLSGSDLGEYDYIERVLYLNRSYAQGDPGLAASTLAHELLHVLQHAEGVPSEALEMELEAHVVTLQVLDELGIAAEKDGSFSAMAAKKLKESPEAYEEWMAGQLPDKLRLSKGMEQAIDDLEFERDELTESIENLEDAYEERGTARLKTKLEQAQVSLAEVQKDLKVLKSKKGQAAYRKLAARTKALLESYHKVLAGQP